MCFSTLSIVSMSWPLLFVGGRVCRSWSGWVRLVPLVGVSERRGVIVCAFLGLRMVFAANSVVGEAIARLLRSRTKLGRARQSVGPLHLVVSLHLVPSSLVSRLMVVSMPCSGSSFLILVFFSTVYVSLCISLGCQCLWSFLSSCFDACPTLRSASLSLLMCSNVFFWYSILSCTSSSPRVIFWSRSPPVLPFRADVFLSHFFYVWHLSPYSPFSLSTQLSCFWLSWLPRALVSAASCWEGKA